MTHTVTSAYNGKGYLPKFSNASILNQRDEFSSVEDVQNKYDLKHPRIVRALNTIFHNMPLIYLPIDKKKQKELSYRFLIVNDEEQCYTNGKRTVIGVNHGTFTKKLDEDFNRAKIVAFHESLHDCFTDSHAWKKACYMYQRQFKNYTQFAADLMNIYEDRRIEYLAILSDEYFRKAFLYIGSPSITNGIQTANSVLEKLNGDPIHDSAVRLMVIRNLILWTGYVRIIPKTNDNVVNEYMRKLFPLIIASREVHSTSDIVDCTFASMDILKPLLDNVIQDSPNSGDGKGEAFDGEFDSKGTTGSSSPSDPLKAPSDVELDDDLEKIIQKGKEMIDDFASSLNGGNDDDDDFIDDSDVDGEGEGEGEDKEGSTTGELNYSGNNSNKQKVFDGKKQDIVDNLANFEYDPDKVEDFKEAVENAQEEINIEESISKDIYEEYVKGHSETTHKPLTLNEKSFNKVLENLGKTNVPDIHKDCVPVFKPKEHMDSYAMQDYLAIKKDVDVYIKECVKKLKEVIDSTHIQEEDELRFGSLGSDSLFNFTAFNETKIFCQKEEFTETFDADFMLLIDESGSQSATVHNEKNDVALPRFVLNRLVAILLHEVLKSIKFNHAVWSFHSGNNENLASIIDSSNCFDKNAGLRLKDISARGGNRDGYSIMLAGEYMVNSFSNDNKILFVLSDGQPASHNYGGAMAIDDIKNQIAKLAQKGVKTIGIFTGDESENALFSQMYENCLFVNNDSIFDLPRLLKELIIRLVLKKKY